jgi:hypothetical protein
MLRGEKMRGINAVLSDTDAEKWDMLKKKMNMNTNQLLSFLINSVVEGKGVEETGNSSITQTGQK